MTDRSNMSKDAISNWLVDWIARELDMTAAEIETARSLLEYSMSSVTATILVGDLEDWLDLRLAPTLVWDFPSINAMTDHLMEQIAAQSGVTPAGVESEADPARLLENLDSLSEEEIDNLLKQLEAKEQDAA
jgi:acyl carrier protein